MAAYEFLASSYDALTRDVPYGRWADYIERHFAKAGRPIQTVLDLACGTGSLTLELGTRGYTIIGVDASCDMLALAEEKCRVLESPSRFFCQRMESLRLPETVDACICCLDSVNYVLQPQKLQRAFARVWSVLKPGGLFLFDADTPEKLRQMDDQIFLDETEDVYCVWRGDFNQKRNICSFWMDIFQRKGEIWLRDGELHQEYAYSMPQLEEFLQNAGFVSIRQYGELKFRSPKPGEQRVFFTAEKGESI